VRLVRVRHEQVGSRLHVLRQQHRQAAALDVARQVPFRTHQGPGGNESYHGLFQPCGGFPDGVMGDSGYIAMPDLPGIGFEGKADLIAQMRKLTA